MICLHCLANLHPLWALLPPQVLVLAHLLLHLPSPQLSLALRTLSFARFLILLPQWGPLALRDLMRAQEQPL